MSYAYLAIAVVAALLVLNAYRPARREPFSVASFSFGWPVGELPIQCIVLEVILTAVFAVLGAFNSWPGVVGLVIAAAGFAGLVGLAVTGQRARRVVIEAFRDATGDPPAPSAPVLPPPQWGRWWRLTRAVPLRARSAEIVRNIDYWGDGIDRHRLDVIRPKNSAGGGAAGAPVMIYVHGGAWVIGNKEEQGKPMMFELVARGWVCVAVNYRLSPKATWPDQIVDCKRAIAWVHEHIAEYGGDPSFIAISGGSAGGHLCALAALTAGDARWQPGFEDEDTSVDACLPFYGVMEMTGAPDGMGRSGPRFVRMLEKQVMKVTQAEHPEVFEQASPTFRVHPGAPPFFVFHGSNDTLVPVEVARKFVVALRAVSNSTVAYAELPLAQHAFDVLASLRCQATTAGVAAFLDAVRAAAPTRTAGARGAVGDQALGARGALGDQALGDQVVGDQAVGNQVA